jgi:hypothetical protein
VHWTTAPLAEALHWRTAAPGVETATLQLAGSGEAWRTRLVVVRLDPAQLRFSLDTALTRSRRPAWNVLHAPSDAVFAINAGQFRGNTPWGLVMLDGRLTLAPERGPLAVTLLFDSLQVRSSVGATVVSSVASTVVNGAAAGASLAAPETLPRWLFDGAPRTPHTQWAFQSYPVLLRDHDVPYALQDDARGLDVGHRDARLAVGRLPNGALLVSLTRFDGLGPALSAVPFGLTVPEMAAVMGALGAQHAVLLDGGISAQLLAGRGNARMLLRGWRDVPLGLVARVRSASGSLDVAR